MTSICFQHWKDNCAEFEWILLMSWGNGYWRVSFDSKGWLQEVVYYMGWKVAKVCKIQREIFWKVLRDNDTNRLKTSNKPLNSLFVTSYCKKNVAPSTLVRTLLMKLAPGGIEKSVTRITNWHHEACRVMANGDHGGVDFSIPSSHEQWILFLAHH